MTKYCSIYRKHLYWKCIRFSKSIFKMHRFFGLFGGFFRRGDTLMTLEIDSYLYYFFFTVVHCFFYRGLVGFWGCVLFLWIELKRPWSFLFLLFGKKCLKNGCIPLPFSVHLFYMSRHCSSQTFSLWAFLLVPDSLKWNSIF